MVRLMVPPLRHQHSAADSIAVEEENLSLWKVYADQLTG
jgi:hypothetical protein